MRTFISLFPDDVSKYVRRWITIGNLEILDLFYYRIIITSIYLIGTPF